MASTNLSLSKAQDIWDVDCSVQELYSSGNYRTIRLYIAVRTTDFTLGRNGGYSVYCEEGGNVPEDGTSIPGSSQSKLVIYDKSFDVYVQPGQTYANINLSFNVHFYSASAGANRELNGSITQITNLSVMSDVAIIAAKNIVVGGKNHENRCSVTWRPPSSSFSYVVKFSLGDFSKESPVISPGATDDFTYTGVWLNTGDGIAEQMPNRTSDTMYVYLYQYSDKTCTEQIGSVASTTITVTLADSFVPKLSNVTMAIVNDSNSYLNSKNIAVSGYSKVKITASAEGNHGSTISYFSIVGSYNSTVYGTSLDYTGGVINSSGNKEFYITCTDSRGRTSAEYKTSTIKFYSYSLPEITKFSVDKNSEGKLVASAEWTYDTIDGNNGSSGTVYYKVSSASDWTPYSSAIISGTPLTLSSIPVNEESSYSFLLVVTDNLGNKSERDDFTTMSTILMDFQDGGRGLGIGKYCEIDNIGRNTSSLEVAMDSYFYGEVYIGADAMPLSDYIRWAQLNVIQTGVIVDLIYPVGSIYITLDTKDPKDLFGGEWEQIRGRFLLATGANVANDNDDYGYMDANVVNQQLGAMGGEAEHKLTIDEMPMHAHWNIRTISARGGLHSPGARDETGKSDGASDPAGSDFYHNNMPPYLAVNMWKRVG